MAALLVGLSIMAVMMTVAMPVWNQQAKREKEAELVFRGEQYARAIGLFQRKAGPGALPPTVDLLVEQRFLRKKYKDPIADDDFVPILLSTATQQGAGQPGQRGQAAGGGTGQQQRSAFGPPQPVGSPGAAAGGITGVTSKSKEQSIRIYKGRTHYNEWQFVFTPPAQAAGAGGGPPGGPGTGGQRGRGQGPGNPQVPPGPGGRGIPPGGGRGGFPQPPGPGNPNFPNPNGPGRGGPVFSPQPPVGR